MKLAVFSAQTMTEYTWDMDDETARQWYRMAGEEWTASEYTLSLQDEQGEIIEEKFIDPKLGDALTSKVHRV